MFGIMEAMLSFLRRQVGLRTDAASSTGSLHAKVRDIKNTIAILGDSTDARADNTVMGWLSSPIKSVQRGTTRLSDAKSVTVSISSVNTAKAVLITTGILDDSADITNIPKHNCMAVLTNSTTITITGKGPYSDVNLTVAWQVIEFY